MKIETKFAPGDKVWVLRPPIDWGWIDPSKLIVAECNVDEITVTFDSILRYLVYLDGEPINFLEAELYATKEEAQEACDIQNRAKEIFNEAVENGSPDADPIEDLKSRVKRMEEKLDRFLKKEIDDGK